MRHDARVVIVIVTHLSATLLAQLAAQLASLLARQTAEGLGGGFLVLFRREASCRCPVILDHLVVIDAVVRRAALIAVHEVGGPPAPDLIVIVVLPTKQASKQLIAHCGPSW